MYMEVVQRENILSVFEIYYKMTLELRIKSAVLTDNPSFGQLNPYVVIYDSTGKQLKKTAAGKGRNPIWKDEVFKYPEKERIMQFYVLDRERLKRGEFVARGLWSSEKIMSRPYEKLNVVLPLEWQGRNAGELTVEVYYDEGRVQFGVENNMKPYLNLNESNAGEIHRTNGSLKLQFPSQDKSLQRARSQQPSAVSQAKPQMAAKNTPATLDQSNVSNESLNTNATQTHLKTQQPIKLPPKAQQPPRPPAPPTQPQSQPVQIQPSLLNNAALQQQRQTLTRLYSTPSLASNNIPNQVQNQALKIPASQISTNYQGRPCSSAQNQTLPQPTQIMPQNLRDLNAQQGHNLQNHQNPPPPQQKSEPIQPQPQRHPALDYLYSSVAAKIKDPDRVRLQKAGSNRFMNCFTLLDGQSSSSVHFSVIPQKLHNN